jgi:hypothetical protein
MRTVSDLLRSRRTVSALADCELPPNERCYMVPGLTSTSTAPAHVDLVASWPAGFHGRASGSMSHPPRTLGTETQFPVTTGVSAERASESGAGPREE